MLSFLCNMGKMLTQTLEPSTDTGAAGSFMFPKEITQYICSFLQLRNLLNFTSTCKDLHSIALPYNYSLKMITGNLNGLKLLANKHQNLTTLDLSYCSKIDSSQMIDFCTSSTIVSQITSLEIEGCNGMLPLTWIKHFQSLRFFLNFFHLILGL